LTAAATPAFIPVRLVGDGHADPPTRAEDVVEIQLRGGDVIRVVGEVSAEWLRVVVTAVRQACFCSCSRASTSHDPGGRTGTTD
jgi:hypothetical protein